LSGRDYSAVFTAESVLAMLEGRKTMTRRLAWIEQKPFKTRVTHRQYTGYKRTSIWQRVKPGDLIWVRENMTPSGALLQYVAGNKTSRHPWPADWIEGPVPGRFMPRAMSRITLTVTAARLEPVQSITEDDALAEGCVAKEGWGPRIAFAVLWNSIHGKGSWEQNPDVVAITFTVTPKNIDQIKGIG